MATKTRLCAPLHPYSGHASGMDWLVGSMAPLDIWCHSNLLSATMVKKIQWS